MIRLHDLSSSKDSIHKKKRVGRGVGSGHGKTACRGHKGQKSRSGGKVRPGFEGGQMPLQRRLPKRGFTNIFKKQYALINLRDLNRFEPDTVVDKELLMRAGLLKKPMEGIKILGDGDISHALVIKANKVSKGARSKVEAAGGKVEVV